MKIALDAGHGGSDPGACGPGGLKESVVAWAVCKLLVGMLERAGVSVIMTREEEMAVSLGDRCETANDYAANYFVSVHCNSDGPQAVGVETLYKTEAGKALALPVQRALVSATGERDRGLKVRTDLYVLNGTRMPAILTEEDEAI